MELMPSATLTTLYNQLKGIELYARQYYLKEGSTGLGASPDPSQGGENGGDEGGGQNSGLDDDKLNIDDENKDGNPWDIAW